MRNNQVKTVDCDKNNSTNNKDQSSVANANITQGITPGYLLEITTTKVSIILKLFEALRDVFKDITMRITPKVWQDGKISDQSAIHIIEFNKAAELFIKIKLLAKEFDKYEVNSESEVCLSLDMISVSKIFKSIPATARMITFFVEEKNPSNLGISILSDPNDPPRTIRLKIIGSTVRNYNPPTTLFGAKITMPAQKFHSIVKAMGSYAEIVHITYTDTATKQNMIQIGCKNDIIPEDTHTMRGEPDPNRDPNSPDVMITGRFDIKVICAFLKFSLMSPNLKLYMRKDDAFIFEYKIAGLGTARFLVAQKQKVNNNEPVEDLEDDSSSEDDSDDDDM